MHTFKKEPIERPSMKMMICIGSMHSPLIMIPPVQKSQTGECHNVLNHDIYINPSY
jgi:hypothetical protein